LNIRVLIPAMTKGLITSDEEITMRTTDLTDCMVSIQEPGPNSNPGAALHSIEVRPIPLLVAKRIMVRHHYLHSLPGGTMLSFGVFLGDRLLGAVTFGAGPQNAFSLVDGAKKGDCLALTRFWLGEELPRNSASRVIGILVRALKRNTQIKFLVTYADPSQGHPGTIYQATGWLYTGLSSAMPLYDIGDGKPRHSRSLGHIFGSHSIEYLSRNGAGVQLVPQPTKHRYVYFLDPTWAERLIPPVLPYPKKKGE